MEAFRFLWAQAQFNFVWIEDARYLADSVAEMDGAKYGVMFSIACRAPFHTFLLAYMLLQFQVVNTQLTEVEAFNLLSLCFRYRRGGIYGAMIFDKYFRGAYNDAKAAADNGRNDVFWAAGKLCSRWIRSDNRWLDAGRLTADEVLSLVDKVS